MSSSPSNAQNNKRPRRRHVVSRLTATVTLMLAHGITPSECFSTVSLSAATLSPATSTRRYFRNTADASQSVVSTAFIHSNPLLSQTQAPPSANKLPSWLSASKDHLWESNWDSLKSSMLSSFFSPEEARQLLGVIEQAAHGDRHLMAGAAEFCLILVETMELGLVPLMAAAVHFCTCVTARQDSLSSQHNVWDETFVADHHAHAAMLGDHASQIARDAGRLKSLEMVASMILRRSDKAASRVTPDSKDAENLRALLVTESKDWRALAIRSAAALYRLKGILAHSNSELTPEALQASREALHIYAPLASRLGMHRLKNELEGAAFRILYRRQYETVNSLAQQLRPLTSLKQQQLSLSTTYDYDNSTTNGALDVSSSMEKVLASVKAEMTRLLQNDDYFSQYVDDFSVTARVKESFSMWKKMLRNNNKHILEVPDALALRIVLDAKRVDDEDEEVVRARERALCYYAQKICMQHWQPAPDPRLKDYIEQPKPNGYQSLHYTAQTMWDNENWNLEIQVRSGEMHQVAEFGLASHWDYKAQQQKSGAKDVTIADHTGKSIETYSSDYLKSVQEWHWQQHAGTTQQPKPVQVVEEETHQKEESLSSLERANRIRARTKKLEPYIQALTEAQSDLAREHVFVFLRASQHKEGKVLALPAGACVLDALREGEKQYGFALSHDFALNGASQGAVTSRLQNGDVLTLPNLMGNASSSSSSAAMAP